MKPALATLLTGAATVWLPLAAATKPWVTSEALRAGITTEGPLVSLAMLHQSTTSSPSSPRPTALRSPGSRTSPRSSTASNPSPSASTTPATTSTA
ncbi:hypothetical protein MPH_11319 [Macrophomina phaseolina MS6]|uniref:Uncharacterized protein n=1 Tax=Macrophomina phaseolina (strain MS6) TaxID=1126212 RepID=K2RB95_MACPH|nr:hypothetical protein MPH_11319 [Macrophomina phaseolina MS6]